MICVHYPKLLQGEWRDRALQLAAKTFELTAFLQDVAHIEPRSSAMSALPRVTYHDGCAGLRELGIREQPRQLLRALCGLETLDANAGRVHVFGRPLQAGGRLAPDIRAQRRQVGIIFQQFNLVGRLPVLTNVLMLATA